MFSSFFIRLRKLENCVRNETIYIKKYFLSEHFHATVLVQWLQRCLFRQGVTRLLLWKLCFRSSYEYSLNDYCLPWFHYQLFPKQIVCRNRHFPGVMKQCYLVASMYQFFLRHAYLTLDFLCLFFIDVLTKPFCQLKCESFQKLCPCFWRIELFSVVD